MSSLKVIYGENKRLGIPLYGIYRRIRKCRMYRLRKSLIRKYLRKGRLSIIRKVFIFQGEKINTFPPIDKHSLRYMV